MFKFNLNAKKKNLKQDQDKKYTGCFEQLTLPWRKYLRDNNTTQRLRINFDCPTLNNKNIDCPI